MEKQKIDKTVIEAAVTEFIDIISYAIDFVIRYDSTLELYIVEMTGDNLGALIGYHGKNIGSIEMLINLILTRKTGFIGKLINLDVNGYRKNRLDSIKTHIENAVNKVLQTAKPYSLNPMPSFERLYVHTLIKDHPTLLTESTGEEPHRIVTIKLKD